MRNVELAAPDPPGCAGAARAAGDAHPRPRLERAHRRQNTSQPRGRHASGRGPQQDHAERAEEQVRQPDGQRRRQTPAAAPCPRGREQEVVGDEDHEARDQRDGAAAAVACGSPAGSPRARRRARPPAARSACATRRSTGGGPAPSPERRGPSRRARASDISFSGFSSRRPARRSRGSCRRCGRVMS